MIKIERYSKRKEQEWNAFLPICKNQTFLFNRNYMDYHSARFIDYSLMVYENDKLVGMLPANLSTDNSTITSHAGLTYGGIIVEKSIRSIKTIEYIYHIIKYLFENRIHTFFFKQIPAFYNPIPSDEVDYAFFMLNAITYRTDIASVIILYNKLVYQERRMRSIKKARKIDVKIVQEDECNIFWNEILTPNLMDRYGVAPVHSFREMSHLMAHNKSHIKQFSAYLNGKIMAGCTVFETDTTAHAQYISGSEEGRANGSLDLLFHELIQTYYSHKGFFDFGIVNEQQGRLLNKGLLDWKEGFGARSYAHRFYKIETKNYHKLKGLVS